MLVSVSLESELLHLHQPLITLPISGPVEVAAKLDAVYHLFKGAVPFGLGGSNHNICRGESGKGATRMEARDTAYAESAKITFDGLQRRSHIGTMHVE